MCKKTKNKMPMVSLSLSGSNSNSIEPSLERCARQKKLVRRRMQEERPLKHKISPFSEHIEPSGRLKNILYMK